MVNKLLLVEDNPDDCALALRAFKKSALDIEVEVAHDGEEALLLLADDDRDLPGMILLDLKLPKVNGLEVLEEIRKRNNTWHIPVVILTSSIEPNDLERSYRLGANSYIRKPVDFTDFTEVISKIGNYWFFLNQSVY